LNDLANALVQTEQGLFVVRHGHRHDDLIEQAQGAPNHVGMPQGVGIEGA